MFVQAVDVVFVNFRSEDDVASAIDDLGSAGAHDLQVSVRVVDCSGMTDEAKAGLSGGTAVPVEVIDAGGNVGFGRAANLGAAAGGAPVIAFLNPDVAVDAAAFAGLVRAGVAGGAVAWSGVLRNPDGSVQANAAPAPSLRRMAAEYLLGADTRLAPATAEREVAVLTGAVLLVDRTAFLAAGGFASDFPLYMEDVDLSCRLSALGRVVQYPIEVGVHTGGASARHAPRETWVLLHASRVAYFAKRGRGSGAVARLVVLAGATIRALIRDRWSRPWLGGLVRATAPGFPLAELLPPRQERVG
ncbi:MAG: N-acetylglucosaminyl-diphospho-decaprenol L-rhamnosyltransferase [Actinomycetota bacterium]|nr:N-acetylglucosaminyl-diphospho-decaprenol L-rhamnosyltransferase [Actinomycetota bacterium]